MQAISQAIGSMMSVVLSSPNPAATMRAMYVAQTSLADAISELIQDPTTIEEFKQATSVSELQRGADGVQLPGTWGRRRWHGRGISSGSDTIRTTGLDCVYMQTGQTAT
jgi:hypothetical protein